MNSVYTQMQPAMKGKLFIEMSTVRPEVCKALAAKVKAAGGSFIECPWPIACFFPILAVHRC